MHLGRLAQQHIQRQIDGLVAKVTVGEYQLALGGCFTNHGILSAFTAAQLFKLGQLIRCHRQYIALLGLVTPDLQRAHARLIIGHLAQVEATTTTTIVD